VVPLKIYNGGSVEQDNLYFIHNIPNLILNSIEIAQGIYWGGCFDSIRTQIMMELLLKEILDSF